MALILKKGLKSAYLLAQTLTSIARAYIKVRKPPKVTHFGETNCKILLFGYMGLGDALMFQPSLIALLKAFPLARFDLFVGKESQSKAILERLIAMEGRAFGEIIEADYKSLSFSELRQLNQQLILARYDITICTYMSPSPYFTRAIMSAPVRVGHSFPWDKWYKPRPNRIFNVSVRLAQDHEHETSRHLRLISELLGSLMPSSTPFLRLSEVGINIA